jgi:transcriptional regulator with XRE-family HTH domain
MIKSTKDSSSPIANKLKQVREELGLSQQQVADMLNRPQSYVSRCEQGIKRLDIEELKEFCLIYKKPIGYFLDE